MDKFREVQCTYAKKLSSVMISFLPCAGKAQVQDRQEWLSDGGGAVLWGRYMAHLVRQGPHARRQSHHKGEFY